MKRLLLLAALTALLLAVTGCNREEPAASNTEPQPPRAQVGNEVGFYLPEYSAAKLDGSKFDLEQERGKVVLLNLWATWCGPCRYEIPELQRIHDRYASRGFAVIGVSVDESGVESVREFVEEQNMTYPVVLDAEGKLATILQTSVLPTTVLVDKGGRILWKKYGLIREGDPELQKAIETAL